MHNQNEQCNYFLGKIFIWYSGITDGKVQHAHIISVQKYLQYTMSHYAHVLTQTILNFDKIYVNFVINLQISVKL